VRTSFQIRTFGSTQKSNPSTGRWEFCICQWRICTGLLFVSYLSWLTAYGFQAGPLTCLLILFIPGCSNKVVTWDTNVILVIIPDTTMKITKKDALYRFIYYSKSVLHVSGDVFAHHQEHLTVFTVSGSVHPSCCRLVSWISCKSVPTLPWHQPAASCGMCRRTRCLCWVTYIHTHIHTYIHTYTIF
jgi:hypothetical protein